jgi:DNA-binding MurR/RpiR family transcriptional regulator
MSLQELIARVNEDLTPTERRISALLLQDSTLLAFGTVSDIADRVGTSRPSIVRFATKLGFDGFTSLQGWVRQDVAKRLSSPSQRIRNMGEGAHAAPIRTALEQAVHETLERLDDARLDSLAAPIAHARSVWILSGETSMAGAIVLHSGLSMVRPHVNLVHEQTAARQLCSARPGDTAVIYDFPRYRRHSIVTARTLAHLGVSIVAITDGPLSPLASLTKTWCELHIPAAGPFDSAVPSVLTSEMITARVVTMLGTKPREQIDRLEDLWQRMGTFLEYVPRDERRNPSHDRSSSRGPGRDEKSAGQQESQNATSRAAREKGPRKAPPHPRA